MIVIHIRRSSSGSGICCTGGHGVHAGGVDDVSMKCRGGYGWMQCHFNIGLQYRTLTMLLLLWFVVCTIDVMVVVSINILQCGTILLLAIVIIMTDLMWIGVEWQQQGTIDKWMRRRRRRRRPYSHRHTQCRQTDNYQVPNTQESIVFIGI